MLREYRQPKDFASFVYLSQVQQAEIIKIGAEHLRRQKPRVMGSLYWQLNDCWPVASWASIDYYGRWKALHYYARRFYDDLLISPFLHDDKVDVYVVSDKLQPLSGTIHARLLDFSGNTLLDQTKDIQVAAQSSAIYLAFDKAELAAKGDPHRSFLAFDLEVAGKKVSRNLIFFDAMHALDLPVMPKISRLLSAKLARTTPSRCSHRSWLVGSIFPSEISMSKPRIIISICFRESLPPSLLSQMPQLINLRVH